MHFFTAAVSGILLPHTLHGGLEQVQGGKAQAFAIAEESAEGPAMQNHRRWWSWRVPSLKSTPVLFSMSAYQLGAKSLFLPYAKAQMTDPLHLWFSTCVTPAQSEFTGSSSAPRVASNAPSAGSSGTGTARSIVCPSSILETLTAQKVGATRLGHSSPSSELGSRYSSPSSRLGSRYSSTSPPARCLRRPLHAGESCCSSNSNRTARMIGLVRYQLGSVSDCLLHLFSERGSQKGPSTTNSWL
mmetsp:Transcript_100401/g.266894  ORF Transcript_100401/g.266894 Transcript_100401/m.266894 type:complete len:243 (+) Transcript_100401:384-1112(+)